MSRLFLKPASAGLHHHSYDPCVVGTMDFGEIDASQVIETVPTDHFTKIKCSGVLRLASMDFPTFGRCYLKTAAFFVPEHQIIEYSDAYHQNMNSYKGSTVGLPVFDAQSILDTFALSSYSNQVTYQSNPTSTGTFPPASNYDFCTVSIVGGNTTFIFYRLTSLGKMLYKYLKMLGYDFPTPTFHTGDTYSDIVAGYTKKFNAIPLLSFAKVYVDMYLSGIQYNNNTLVYLLHCIHNNESCVVGGYTYYDASTHEITQLGLQSILTHIYVPHQQDIYTEAWNSPNSPDGLNPALYAAGTNQGLVSPYLGQGAVGSGSSDSVAVGSNNTVIQNHNAEDLKTLTAFGQRMFNAIDKFVRRWDLGGTKAAQRLYASFGIKSDDFNSHYVHKLYEGSTLIDPYPVISNADTVNGSNGLGLGDYAGYASAGLNFEFDYKSSDYGVILILHWIQVKPILLRGVNPFNLKRFPFDFYTPELDGKAIRPIPACEVSVVKQDNKSGANTSNDNTIYGFTNLYDDMRELRSNVFGDFVVSNNVKNYAWMRDFSVLRNSSTSLKPQFDDVQYYGLGIARDMTDPFQMSVQNGDRFFLFLQYDIDAERPVLTETESFDLNGTGDIEISKNGIMLN